MCHTQFHSNLLFGLICIKLIMLRLCLHIFICDRDRSYWIFLTFDASQEFSTWNSCVIFFMSILKIRYFRSWKFHFCPYPQVQIEGTLYSPMRIESTYQVYWLLSHGFLSLTATNFVKYHPKIMHYCFFF